MAIPAIIGVAGKVLGGLFGKGKGGGKGMGGAGGGGKGMGGAGLGIAIGAGQSILGAIKAKKAEGMAPALVDPKQQGMANQTSRMLRANTTGTNDMASLKQNAALAKTMGDKSMYSGGRSMAQIMDMTNKQSANIAAQSREERMGLLGALVKQTQDISDRKMDLQGLAQSKKEAQAEGLKKSGGANLMAGLTKMASPKGGGTPLEAPSSEKGVNKKVGKNVGKGIGGMLGGATGNAMGAGVTAALNMFGKK